MRTSLPHILIALAKSVTGVNFPWESVQLTDELVGNFSAVAFGSTAGLNPHVTSEKPACRAFPGTPEWPLDEEWTQLNNSLDGALLEPNPPGACCYPGPFADAKQCNYVLGVGRSGRFYLNDPLTVLTQWPQGETCPAMLRPTGNCTHGGFPTYVVNVTTVKQVQAAVNFARNKNVRLVIKNTGHDFVGRSTGAGSLSIWTHWLKSFDFIPQYSQGNYSGMAARVGSGLEAWELQRYMVNHNVTIVVPSGYTVGPFGGWIAGGGHSLMGSIKGLGSDQVLSLQVVTADGRFLTADPTANTDLYYALRGGGPSTYGVVTSAVVKVHPHITVMESTLRFTGNFPKTNGSFPEFNFTNLNFTNPFNSSRPRNFTTRPSAVVSDPDTFWHGVNLYFKDGKRLCDQGGGAAYSYITPTGNTSISFETTFQLPGKTPQEAFDFLQPIFTSLNAIGIAANNTMPAVSKSWSASRNGEGDGPGNVRFATRLFPRRNWEDDTLFNATMKIIRDFLEAGYTSHGVQIGPTGKAGGYPALSGANPAWRTALMHGDFFDRYPVRGMTAKRFRETHSKLSEYVDKIRAVTPSSGAYINEADALEPEWQQSFFGGANYARLLEIKKNRDPWGVFWARTTVGSEDWEVRTADGMPSQNGVLCRVETGTKGRRGRRG